MPVVLAMPVPVIPDSVVMVLTMNSQWEIRWIESSIRMAGGIR
jgi:hypothetical protein